MWNLNSREGVNHGRHRGFVPRADVVKVQHALHGASLHAPHDGLGLLPEESGGFGCTKAADKSQGSAHEHRYRHLKNKALTGQRLGGGGVGGNHGNGRSVTRQDVDDDTARQRKEINLHTLINPLQLIRPYSNTSLRGLSLEELHRRLTWSSIGIFFLQRCEFICLSLVLMSQTSVLETGSHCGVPRWEYFFSKGLLFLISRAVW